MRQFKFLVGMFAFSLLLLGAMPQTAAAQYGDILEGVFGGRSTNRDRSRDSYSRRAVSEAIRRVDSRADRFRDVIDRALDDSRYDGRRNEDRILSVAENFEDAAARLESVFDDGRNVNRSADEARQLLQLGRQIENFVYNRNGRRLDQRVQNEWSAIRNDLQTIANFYGYNFGYSNDRVNRRDRRNDDIYDDDDYRNERRNRRNNRYPF
jgi:hypothetical protein